MPVAFSISVLSRDRRSKAFSSRAADPSNLRPVMHQSKIAVETKCNSIKLAFLNTRSLKNKSFVINDLITTNNLDFMFLIETWLEDNCSATVLTETAPHNFNFISVCRTVMVSDMAGPPQPHLTDLPQKLMNAMTFKRKEKEHLSPASTRCPEFPLPLYQLKWKNIQSQKYIQKEYLLIHTFLGDKRKTYLRRGNQAKIINKIRQLITA